MLTVPEDAESTSDRILTGEEVMFTATIVDYSNHRYIFHRRSAETDQIKVVREDGSKPPFEEIQPVVDLVLQFHWLRKRYEELYLHGFGDYLTYRELVELLANVGSYFPEYSDVFPIQAFGKLENMAKKLVHLFDVIAKTMQQIDDSLKTEKITKERVEEIRINLTTVIETYQQQAILIMQNIGYFQQLVQYLHRHIAIWQIKWRRISNRLQRILDELYEDVSLDGKWFESVVIDDHLQLPDEEKEKAYSILENQKLLLKEA